MLGSAGAQAIRPGPVFFFDQPTRRNQTEGNFLNFMIRSAGPQPEDAPLRCQQEGVQKGESNNSSSQNPSGIACEDEERDPSSSSVSAAPRDPMDAYRRAAPHLLNDLARLLSQRKWSEEGRVPRGVVNILNYSWHDLTAEATLRLRRPAAMTENRRRSKESPKAQKTSRGVSDGAGEETGERNSGVERNAGSFLTKDTANQSERKKKRSSKGAVRISVSVWSCEDAGGIAQPEQHRCDEPESVRVSQWVVEPLRAARNPQNLPPSEQDPRTAPVVRHYGDGGSELTNDRRRRRTKAVAPLVDVLPQTPEVKLQSPVQRKLQYRINDGSSFIYYPSGCLAVCQSLSGLPHAGFYTNVFSDGQRPAVLLTITAFGRGSVTDAVSSTISAMWDQDGGFRFDNYGNTTEEWSWPTYRPLRRIITMQVSEEISVKLLSGTSGLLSFRCEEESVRLRLRFAANESQMKKVTENKFSSGAAQELRLLKKQKSPAGVSENKMSLRKTPVVREEEQQVEPSALWRRRSNAVWELQRLQQRVRDAAEGWLDYYRVAVGIKCPNAERLPGAPPRARLRRAPQSAALTSPDSLERAAAAPWRAGGGRRDELGESHGGRHSASAEERQDRLVQMQRRPKESRKETPVTQIGPLRIHGNIEPGSVTLSRSLEPETSGGPAADRGPAAPCVPLAMCPALLRAALRGEERQRRRRRRCCCSATLMPVVTDLEYDAFITGQPPDSKQILVMCVTAPQRPVNTRAAGRWEDLEDLYRKRNEQRTMPCTQCQTDSFRLVRYEMSDGKATRGSENVLLQQRHAAAPGMFLMYLKGKLLFLGYIGGGDSCSAVDLQRQISRTRRDSRLGLSLPANHKFSDVVKTPAATEAYIASEAEGCDSKMAVSEEEGTSQHT